MNFDRFLAALFSKRALLILCIIVLGIFCLSACTVEDGISCMFCGIPTCKTMENCSNSISNCRSDCNENVQNAICDCTCQSLENFTDCYNDCAEGVVEGCPTCAAGASCWVGGLRSCFMSCFIDENGNETDCGAAGGDCDDYFVDEPDNRKE